MLSPKVTTFNARARLYEKIKIMCCRD